MKKINKAYVKKFLPKRPDDSYKNLNGRVLIVAGSADMPGAAVLCARACYASGAGVVTLAAPKPVYNAAANTVPQAVILDLPGNPAAAVKKIISYNKKIPHDLLLVGPGLGAAAKTMLKILAATKLPAVIDADALNYLAQSGPQKLAKNILYILTPHIGEMRRLLKTQNIDAQSADKLAKITGAVCLLKGPRTIVSNGGKTMQNTTGNSGLAKAGSGDILAGIIAGIWAQTPLKKSFEAAAMGVWLHGAAADKAVKKTGKRSLMAGDILAALPLILKKL